MPGRGTNVVLKVVGYSDPLSVAPGELLRFMVSSTEPSYEAQLVRLVHGDLNPEGPGYKEHELVATLNGTYPGAEQLLRHGSYVIVPDAPALSGLEAWTLILTLLVVSCGVLWLLTGLSGRASRRGPSLGSIRRTPR